MTQQHFTETLGQLLFPCARRVEADIELWLIDEGTPCALAEAMRYCVLGGGKRLRPGILYLAAEAAGQSSVTDTLRRCAVAVELIHCYSLVHDDLPAMDNDSLRRGRPTAHVKYGQAMAILAGDALLTRAWGVLAECRDAQLPRLVCELASAAGSAGMIAGQVADMDMCDVAEGFEGLREIHMNKTGAMIRASGRMGAICAGAGEDALQAITEYSVQLGLAFQLIDDLLDVTGDAATLGKTPGKDVSSDKRTHVALLGQKRAAELGREMTSRAVDTLVAIGPQADMLRRLAILLGERTH